MYDNNTLSEYRNISYITALIKMYLKPLNYIVDLIKCFDFSFSYYADNNTCIRLIY